MVKPHQAIPIPQTLTCTPSLVAILVELEIQPAQRQVVPSQAILHRVPILQRRVLSQVTLRRVLILRLQVPSQVILRHEPIRQRQVLSLATPRRVLAAQRQATSLRITSRVLPALHRALSLVTQLRALVLLRLAIPQSILSQRVLQNRAIRRVLVHLQQLLATSLRIASHVPPALRRAVHQSTLSQRAHLSQAIPQGAAALHLLHHLASLLTPLQGALAVVVLPRHHHQVAVAVAAEVVV